MTQLSQNIKGGELHVWFAYLLKLKLILGGIFKDAGQVMFFYFSFIYYIIRFVEKVFVR